ncbi:MAG TPA: AAA family ATPase [Pseudonocardiaceae bacterium]|jgi:DNA-binding CsgD family transcriptional regulator|nr:AAA family ATPase [Pseudonocardiaceae bacterium]
MASPSDAEQHAEHPRVGTTGPHRAWSGAHDALIERDEQLKLVEQAVTDTMAGRSALVTVSGRPGTGRSALLAVTAGIAEQAGLRVVAAQCSPNDRGVRNGIMTQLLAAGPVPAGHPLRRDPALLDDRNGFAGMVARPGRAADRRPVAVVVDDAQWADQESARWLWALPRRAKDIPVLVVAAFNSASPGRTDGTEQTELRLAPLSPDGIRRLLEQIRGEPADEVFTQVAAQLTAGNPAVLRRALDRFAAGTLPTTEFVPVFARDVAQVRHDQVARILDGLPDESLPLLRAVAACGTDLEFPLVCALAGLRVPEQTAMTALLRTGLVPDERSRSLDPDVAEQVLAAMDTGARRNLYARAATLGRAAAVADEALGQLLLHAEPINQDWAVTVLHASARVALSAGRHGLAAELLGRALLEPCTATARAELLVELSAAEAWLSPESADRRLRQILLETTGPDAAPQRLVAADLLLCRGDRSFAQRAITSVHARGDIGDAERASMLGLYWLADHHQHSQPELAIPGPPPLADRPTDPVQACVVAANNSARGIRIAESRELARAALACWAGPERLFAPRAAAARVLSLTDDLDEAVLALDELIADARRRGVRAAIGLALSTKADVLMRSGRLTEAADSLRELLADVPHNSWIPPLLPKTIAIEIELNVESGDLDRAERAAVTPLRPGAEHGVGWTRMLYARGLLDLAADRPERAVAQFRETGRRMSASRWTNPATLMWRSHAALAYQATGEPSAALRLFGEDIRHAEAWGARSPLGRVHLLAGLAIDGEQGHEHLRQAASLLRGGPDTLRYGKAMAELTLRAAADRTAAVPLSGAQLRVAGLAADGISNRVIASMLSITRRTVELHLTNAYRKLGISGRDELSAALGRTERNT